jgi:hypothetical protein
VTAKKKARKAAKIQCNLCGSKTRPHTCYPKPLAATPRNIQGVNVGTGYPGWCGYCGIPVPLPAAPKRIVLGEGLLRIIDDDCSVLLVKSNGDPIQPTWPNLPGDPRVRLVLEVIE